MISTFSAKPKAMEPQPAPRGALSTPRIVFLVIAAAAPLASMIGNLPIALGRGNGVGTPGAFVLAGAILLCFAVGYAAMSRRIVDTGAFYAYVTQGLGTAAGIGAAYVAVLAYLAFTVGLAAFFGYFTQLVLAQAGLQLPWPLYGALGLVAVAVLGYRSVDLSARVLGVLMIAEVVILAVFDATVLSAKGLATALPLAAVAPSTVFTPGLGVSLMVAFTCFLGFESAALYGEEAADPRRSIPIATYTAVVAIAAFYLFTAWVVVGALLPGDVAARANAESGELMFNLFTRYGGDTLTAIMGLLTCLSLLASFLAIHNAATRYLFALGREWLLPPYLGVSHVTSGAPSRASLTVSALTLLALIPFALAGTDPFHGGVLVLIGFGSFGIIFLQCFAAIAILVYLRRVGGEPAWVMTATSLGALGLVGATLFVAVYFRLLATSDSAVVAALPLVFPAIVAVCWGIGGVLGLIRVDEARPWQRVVISPEKEAAAGPEFHESGTAAPWVVAYETAAGRPAQSDPLPTRAAALDRARALRLRGATVREIAGRAE